MNLKDGSQYDKFIFDGAKNLAVMYGQDVTGMQLALFNLGVRDNSLLYKVELAQTSLDYEPKYYKGVMCDEGVVDAVKDCLLIVHEF